MNPYKRESITSCNVYNTVRWHTVWKNSRQSCDQKYTDKEDTAGTRYGKTADCHVIKNLLTNRIQHVKTVMARVTHDTFYVP